MFSANKYFDYCVSEDLAKNHLDYIYELGYRTIAVNQIVKEIVDMEPKRKKKKGLFQNKENNAVEIVPDPIEIKNNQYPDMKILKRLTIYFTNNIYAQQLMKSPNCKKYDIVAVVPETDQAFSFVCSNLDIDILSFEPENKMVSRLSRKKYNFLINKGCFFELLYSPAIEDQTKRKNIISRAHEYFTFGKSKNIIISSGAHSRILLRSPYDVINLGVIFGLNEQQSKDAVGHNGFRLYTKSVGRCYGKGAIFVENITNEESSKISEKIDEDIVIIDDSVIEIDET